MKKFWQYLVDAIAIRPKKKPEYVYVPVWYWSCYDCLAEGEGTEEEVRKESTEHLLTSAHSVGGRLKED